MSLADNKSRLAVGAGAVLLVAVGLIAWAVRGGGLGAADSSDPAAIVQGAMSQGIYRCSQQAGVKPGNWETTRSGAGTLVTLHYTQQGTSRQARWIVTADREVRAQNQEAQSLAAGCP